MASTSWWISHQSVLAGHCCPLQSQVNTWIPGGCPTHLLSPSLGGPSSSAFFLLQPWPPLCRLGKSEQSSSTGTVQMLSIMQVNG